MKCPKCGTELPSGASQCPKCGQRFTAGKYCPHCRAVIPAAAAVCPKCQKPVGAASSSSGLPAARSKKQSGFRWWRVPIYLLVLAVGFGLGNLYARYSLVASVASTIGQPSSSPAAQDTEKQANSPVSACYFRDNVLVSEDVKIEITDWKVIPVGETGNEHGESPVIAFWYNTTNRSGKENISPMTAWIAMFTAVQDNDPNMVNELNVAMLPDQAFLDTQTAAIKKDGTAPCAVAYELDDNTTPVVLQATKGVLGESLGEQTFEIASK